MDYNIIIDTYLPIYTPTYQHANNLWTGECWTDNLHTYRSVNQQSTDITGITWNMWYLYWDAPNNVLKHRVADIAGWDSTTYEPKRDSTHIINPDIRMGIDFTRPYGIDIKPDEDYWPSVFQMDAGVFGYCSSAPFASLTQYYSNSGLIDSIPVARSWDSFIPDPVPGDDTRKRYRFYGIDSIPGYLTVGRSAYLESFMNDRTPFQGEWLSIPKKFKGNNYAQMVELMNSQVAPYVTNCYDNESAPQDPLAKLAANKYCILNIKPGGNSVNPGVPYAYSFNFPFKLDASSTGAAIPWTSNSGITNPLVQNCMCWNSVSYRLVNGGTQNIGFLSNGHCVGNVIQASKVPTNYFTYTGLDIKNRATTNGPGGYSFAAGELFEFRVCPSLWHLSPSIDVIYHNPKSKWRMMHKLQDTSGHYGSLSLQITRAGFSDISDEKLAAC